MSTRVPKLALRWIHAGYLMNIALAVEVDGVEIARDPFYWEASFKKKVAILKTALGVKRVPRLGKWVQP